MNTLITGLVLLILGIALGAFGTHILADFLSEKSLKTYQTANFYHLIIALSLISLAPYLKTLANKTSSFLIISGVLLFSGSLYLLSIFKLKSLAFITPVGGLCILSGLSLSLIQLIKKNN